VDPAGTKEAGVSGLLALDTVLAAARSLAVRDTDSGQGGGETLVDLSDAGVRDALSGDRRVEGRQLDWCGGLMTHACRSCSRARGVT
jgi:hypothetical protein